MSMTDDELRKMEHCIGFDFPVEAIKKLFAEIRALRKERDELRDEIWIIRQDRDALKKENSTMKDRVLWRNAKEGFTMTTPGPELDRQVAEEVCKWTPSGLPWVIPAFSTDHNAFFKYVVPAMREKGLSKLAIVFWETRYSVTLHFAGRIKMGDPRNLIIQSGESIPHAGCLAALEAVRSMKDG